MSPKLVDRLMPTGIGIALGSAAWQARLSCVGAVSPDLPSPRASRAVTFWSGDGLTATCLPFRQCGEGGRQGRVVLGRAAAGRLDVKVGVKA